jgi:hypothetical protein
MKPILTHHKTKLSVLLAATLVLASCTEDIPKKEDVPELVTRATLTFTPEDAGDVIVVSATDPDGDGIHPIVIDGDIRLASNKTYILTLTLSNTLVAESDPAYDITGEVAEEGDEHMFFFGWTNDVFSNPEGDGNIDDRAGVVQYTGGDYAMDENGLPLGLTTTWTTSATNREGTFDVILKHQPGIKTVNSGSDIGETDLMLSFPIIIEE